MTPSWRSGSSGGAPVSPRRSASFVQTLLFVALVACLAVCAASTVRYTLLPHAGDVTRSARWLLTPTLSGLAAIFFAAALLYRAERGSERALWLTSLTFTALCLVGQAVVWHFLNVESSTALAQPSVVASQDQTETYLRSHGVKDNVLRVPTGLYVQSIEFTNANDVTVGGYVWQKYPANAPKDMVRGVVLPEADNAYEMAPAYDVPLPGGVRLVGWRFHATIRQRFAYDDYPFDRQDVWLRMWAKDFSRGAILVPDFASYDSFVPQDKPGLEQDFVQEGWTTESTFFDYRQMRYTSSFGWNRHADGPSFPELYFNIELKRLFLRTLIEHIIPLTVAALLLFSLMFLSTGREEFSSKSGFTGQDALALIAAIFFVIILAHIQLRSSIPTNSVMYLEYYYFAMDVVILAVTANVVLLSSPVDVWLVEYRDNLIPKLLFWPLLIGGMLVASVVRFLH